MNEQDIHKLLADGERVTLECKKAQNNVPNTMWETYSAFANTYGGTILCGIFEDKTLVLGSRSSLVSGMKSTG